VKAPLPRSREARFAVWTLAAVGVAVAAFFAGSRLKPKEELHFVYDTEAVAFAEVAPIAATSRGGFTGLEGMGPGSTRAVIAGRVVELAPGRIVLESADGVRTSVRFGPQPKLWRLEPGDRSLLVAGATVAVRKGEADDEAAAVLVLGGP